MRAFFAAPFAEDYRWVRNAVATACRQLDVELRAVDERVLPGASIIEAIHQEIDDCDLGVSVLSGLNPNVMYELGRLLQLSKPTILLADEGTLKALPFDIKGFSTIRYDAESHNENDLADAVYNALSKVKEATTSEQFRDDIKSGKLGEQLVVTKTAVEVSSAAIDFEEIRKTAEKMLGKQGCNTTEIVSQPDNWEQTLRCPGGDDVLVIIDLNGNIIRAKVK